MSGWNSPWNVNLTDVIAQAAESASALKDNLEKKMDEALQGEDEGEGDQALGAQSEKKSKEDGMLSPGEQAAAKGHAQSAPKALAQGADKELSLHKVAGQALDFFGDFGVAAGDGAKGKQEPNGAVAALDIFAEHLGLSSDQASGKEGKPDGEEEGGAEEDEGFGANEDENDEIEDDADMEEPRQMEVDKAKESHADEYVDEQDDGHSGGSLEKVQVERDASGSMEQMEQIEEQTMQEQSKANMDITPQQLDLFQRPDMRKPSREEDVAGEAEEADVVQSDSDERPEAPEDKEDSEEDKEDNEEDEEEEEEEKQSSIEEEEEGSGQPVSGAGEGGDDTIGEEAAAGALDACEKEAPEEAVFDAEENHRENEEGSGIALQRETVAQEDGVPSLKTNTSDIDAGEGAVEALQEQQQLIAERERQLEVAVTRCAKLTEELDTLRDQHASLQSAFEKSSASSSRVADLESEVQTLKSTLEETEVRADSLLEEGLELSKKQGNLETTLRKVRKELKEEKALTVDLRAKLETALQKKDTLQAEVEEIRAIQARGERSMAQISESSVEAQRRLEELEKQLKAAKVKEAEYKQSLEDSFQDLSDQKKANKQVNQQLNSARSDLEHLRHQLKEQISSVQMRNDRAATMEKSVSEARQAMQQQQREWEVAEASLRDEIKLLQKRLQEQERRNEDLVESSATATAPLIRQIEGLKSMAEVRQNSLAATQATMLARAVSAEKAEVAAMQAKREAEDQRDDLSLKLAELQASVVSLKSEKARMESVAKMTKERAEQAENERQVLAEQLQDTRSKLDLKSKELRSTESNLRKALLVEEERHEKEVQQAEAQSRKEASTLRETIKSLETRIASLTSSQSESNVKSKSEIRSRSGSSTNSTGPENTQRLRKMSSSRQSQGDILSGLNFDGDAAARTPTEIDFGPSTVAGSIQVERLKAQLTQRVGEIQGYKLHMASVERSRDALAEEMVRLSEEVQRLRGELKEAAGLKAKCKELGFKQEVLLGLLGEKEEAVDELKADLAETKRSYQSQIDALSKQLPMNGS